MKEWESANIKPPIIIDREHCSPALLDEIRRRLEGLTYRLVKDDAAWERHWLWDL